ncbi:Na+/H+ antiporter NhaC family protein [Crateriforma conspicua]|uniref:Malate-2H(+)/Na(+)-lactate antiporter n=1 Tax=Crateriforma conspicua TaxID=2527996 RepID=A0A5C5YDC1_9PLAN|nr:Na+/H+ antiporter NhaC family protein [Crateriforma conspicua]TWT71312.1 Malate-2H(+)/Na(+)-lactate antiporter [Crateriforma conspicua]
MADASWLSLLPPVVAIVLAILTGRVYISLTLGVLSGAALLATGQPDSTGTVVWMLATIEIFVRSLWQSVTDFYHLQVLVFSLLLGAMVGVLESGGAIPALLQRISHRVRSRRGAQLLISCSGLAIFFDDYANTLMIGGAFRSTADRYRISRARLAYLVDSTAAPVAGLALVSTWVATEISYLQEGLQQSGWPDTDRTFEIFVASVPYRFYPILAIVMVMWTSVSGREYGPMASQSPHPLPETPGDDVAAEDSGATNGFVVVIAAVLPVVLCVTAVLATLVQTGWPQEPFPSSMSGLQRVGTIIGGGDSYLALVVGGGVGLVSAWIGAAAINMRPLGRVGQGALAGAGQMLPAMLVLWLAWALSAMTSTDQLNTSGYLSSMLRDTMDVRWLPTVTFLLAGAVAFSTGTSWGTMAILTPIVVALAIRMSGLTNDGGVDLAEHSIFLATFGSVLAGAIFGDHCSPISDTTVLSSRASGCDHMVHVRTQMPYAITVGVVCVLVGTLPVAVGWSPWICLLAGACLLIGWVRWYGRPVDQDGVVA